MGRAMACVQAGTVCCVDSITFAVQNHSKSHCKKVQIFAMCSCNRSMRHQMDHRNMLLHASRNVQGPVDGGGSDGGVLDFFGFPGFSRFFLIFSAAFPIGPFPLSRPIKSTYKEHSRNGPRHNRELSRKKVGNPPVWKTPVYLLSKKKTFHAPKATVCPKLTHPSCESQQDSLPQA